METRKIALALQGSFGHICYAAGILDAFREHNHRPRAKGDKHITFEVASGCVEMLTPLSMYLADQDGGTSLREAIVNGDGSPLWAQISFAPPMVRMDAVESYWRGRGGAQERLATAWVNLLLWKNTDAQDPSSTPGQKFPFNKFSTERAVELVAACQDISLYTSGIPGWIAFNPLFVAEKSKAIEGICRNDEGPTIFTNATRANDLDEIYLYSGKAPTQSQTRSMQSNGKRQVLRLTPEYFFASGARPPYIAPIPVMVDGRTERWMEGAMRCDPPLNPLIDMGATHIVLLRLFAKDAKEEPNNNGELNERFLDAIFNIPLQKEIESIAFNNKVAKFITSAGPGVGVPQELSNRRVVEILDPSDARNPAHYLGYSSFLENDLGSLSHYEVMMMHPALRAQMFDQGFDIGKDVIRHLQKHLP